MKQVVVGVAAVQLLCACQLTFATTGTWQTKGSPPRQISTNNVVTLADGRVAIFGIPLGDPSTAPFVTMFYDPSTDSWSAGKRLPGPPQPDVAALLPDGTVLVEGGLDLRLNVTGATWLYHPADDSWSKGGNVIEPRQSPGFTVLSDGRVLIAGGAVPATDGGNPRNIASAELFDPATRKWSRAGQMLTARAGFSLLPLPDAQALAAGGCVEINVFPEPGMDLAETFDPLSLTWRATAPMPVRSCNPTGVALQDGRAMLVDQADTGNSTNGAFVYEPISRRWTRAGQLASDGFAALTLSDGRVLVPEIGSSVQKGRHFIEQVGGQIFDPAKSQWSFATTTTVSIPLAYAFQRGRQLAASLPNSGAVLFLPGAILVYDSSGQPPTADVLDTTGLTIWLLVAVAVIAALVVVAYRLAMRSEPDALR